MEGINGTFLSALFSRPPQKYFLSNGIFIMLLPLLKLFNNLLLLFRYKPIFLMCSIVSCPFWPRMTSLVSTHSEIPHSALCTSVRVAFFQQLQCTLLSLTTGPLHLLLQLSEMFSLFLQISQLTVILREAPCLPGQMKSNAFFSATTHLHLFAWLFLMTV